MTTDISTELPEQFTDKYFIYNGTDTIEEMVENIEKLTKFPSDFLFDHPNVLHSIMILKFFFIGTNIRKRSFLLYSPDDLIGIWVLFFDF